MCCLMGLQCSACLVCPVCGSDVDAPVRSLGGCTVQDGAVGVLQAIMMVVFVYSFQKSYIIFFFLYHNLVLE